MNAVFFVQFRRPFRIVLQQFAHLDGFAVSSNVDLIDVVRSQTAAAPQNSRLTGNGALENRVSFGIQPVRIKRRHPVHVVKENKAADFDVVMRSKELLD